MLVSGEIALDLSGKAWRSAIRSRGLGVTCNGEGAFFGHGVPLLEATVLPGGRRRYAWRQYQ
jgi:hypothetical protein